MPVLNQVLDKNLILCYYSKAGVGPAHYVDGRPSLAFLGEKMLSKAKKKQAEDIAYRNYLEASKYYRSDKDRRKKLAKEWTKQDIESLRNGFGRQYGSVISSILISLMLRFAFKLLEKWLENKLDELVGE